MLYLITLNSVHKFGLLHLWFTPVIICTTVWLRFPGGSAVKNLPAMQETQEM